MKRRNLFLSLISSILVAVAIVTVTVVSVVKTNKKNNNGTIPGASNINTDIDYSEYEDENLNRDGSKKSPYIIYSADSFIDMVGTYGNSSSTYFEVVKDIDFAGVDYVTLFNDRKSFKANINGNGHSLNNITIHVTTANVKDFGTGDYVYVALFGTTNGAEIENLVIDNMNVSVDSDVYDYVVNGKDIDVDGFMVSSIACRALNTNIDKITLNSNIEGFSHYFGVAGAGKNVMGGVVGYADGLTLTNSNINSNIDVVAEGSSFHIGGVAGCAKNSIVESADVDVKVSISSDNDNINIGGVFSQANIVIVDTVNVNLEIKSKDSADKRASYVENLGETPKASDMPFGAGVVAFVRANTSLEKSTFNNINVTANVDADIVYAGAFVGTITNIEQSNFAKNLNVITIKDVIVNTNANVLAVHGFSRDLALATVSYTNTSSANYFNIKLSGSVKLDSYLVASTYTRASVSLFNDADFTSNYAIDVQYSQLYIEISQGLNNKINTFTKDWWSVNTNQFESFKIAD